MEQSKKKKRGNPNPCPSSRFQKSHKAQQITVGFRVPVEDHARLEQLVAEYDKVSPASVAKLILLEALKHPELCKAALDS